MDDLPPLEENPKERLKKIAATLGPDPFVEGLMTEGSSEFFLFIYTVIGADFQKQLGTIGEIFSYLEENGEVVGKLSFKSGSTVKFFQAVQEYTGGLDLLAILGSTVEENPPEDELCCGLLEWQIAQQASERLSGLAQDPANAKRFEERATKLGLDAAWALESAKHLSGYLAKACEDTKEAKGVIMGLFE